MPKSVAIAVVGAVLLGLPSFALAQPPAPRAQASTDPKEEAYARWKRGMELFEEQDFNSALIEFRKAYELAPSYKVLYNIGQVCYQLTDYACALNSFQRYLKDGGSNIATERRQQVEKDIDRLQARIGKLEIVTNVAGADVFVDDVLIGKSPLEEPVVVSSGKRKITVTKEGRTPITRIVDVAGTDSLRVEFTLAEVGRITMVPGPARAAPSKWTTLSWVGVGGAAGLALVGGVFGLLAMKQSSDLENRKFVGTPPPSDVSSDSSRVKAFSLTADILFGASLVTLATTVIITITHTPKDDRKASGVSWVLTPAGVSLGGRFQ